jgi:hypothetical protein
MILGGLNLYMQEFGRNVDISLIRSPTITALEVRQVGEKIIVGISISNFHQSR